MAQQIAPPLRGGPGEARNPVPRHRDLKQAYAAYSFNLRPTVLLTLTVREPKGSSGGWRVSESVLIKKANLLLLWINADLFGRKFLKNGSGLKGFGCIEEQANHQPHAHLAITTPMPPKRFQRFRKALHQKIKKIDLFESTGTDIRLINGDDVDYWRVGNYIAKDGHMITLGPEGIW